MKFISSMMQPSNESSSHISGRIPGETPSGTPSETLSGIIHHTHEDESEEELPESIDRFWDMNQNDNIDEITTFHDSINRNSFRIEDHNDPQLQVISQNTLEHAYNGNFLNSLSNISSTPIIHKKKLEIRKRNTNIRDKVSQFFKKLQPKSKSSHDSKSCEIISSDCSSTSSLSNRNSRLDLNDLDGFNETIFCQSFNDSRSTGRFRNIQIYEHTKRKALELITCNQDMPDLSLKIIGISVNGEICSSYSINNTVNPYNYVNPKDFTYETAIHISKLFLNKLDNTINTINDIDIQLVQADCLNVAYNLLAKGEVPLVLNMANPDHPGGGVENGATAQEETIFRRSNYFMTLLPEYYPLYLSEAILSQRVQIFKDHEYNMITPYNLSFIAVAAIQNPLIKSSENTPYRNITNSSNDYLNEEDRNIMRYKIYLIFITAIHFKYKSLVLTALGCGAFHNPPEAVAKLYYEAIAFFQAYFTSIHISIIDNERSNNFEIFKKILTGDPHN